MKLPTLKCLRCGYKWIPRKEKLPKNCASEKCNSPYWDKKRKVNPSRVYEELKVKK